MQGKEILRIAPKFDLAKYAESLTYKDEGDSRRSLEGLSLALTRSEVLRAA